MWGSLWPVSSKKSDIEIPKSMEIHPKKPEHIEEKPKESKKTRFSLFKKQLKRTKEELRTKKLSTKILRRVRQEKMRKIQKKLKLSDKDIELLEKHRKLDIDSSKTTYNLKRHKTGIEGFDRLFKKGIPDGASVLVEGGPGSGKTLFCLHLAYNLCKQGKRVLYMSFEEPKARLISHMENFGWQPQKFVRKGTLLIKRFNALDIARSVEALLSEAKKELLIDIQPVLIPMEFKPNIVCIDSLSSIASAFSGEESRFRIYMEQLFRYLESNDITSFLIRETSNPTHVGGIHVEKGEAVSFLSDGIIIVYNVIFPNGNRRRAVEVLKMRGEDERCLTI